MGSFWGGKNSFWRKPFGDSDKKGSVANFTKNTVGDTAYNLGNAGAELMTGNVGGAANSAGKAAKEGLNQIDNIFKGGQQNLNSITPAQVEAMMNKGQAKGEELTGTTSAEVGQGRKDIRKRLKETLDGNSAELAALRQNQQQDQKNLRAQQALGGGGQMNEGQMQALKRQANMDAAVFDAQRKRQALSDLSKEFRGAGSDIFRSTGQMASIMVGAQQPQVPQRSGLDTLLQGTAAIAPFLI